MRLKTHCPYLVSLKAHILVPETGSSWETDFIVLPNEQVSLLSNKTSKELGVLKISVDAGTPVNRCHLSPGDKWLYLQEKYLSVFNGHGLLEARPKHGLSPGRITPRFGVLISLIPFKWGRPNSKY